MPELLPLMNIDFTPHRLKAGDTIEFITKMNTMQELIEAWGLNLGTYGELIDALLVQARNVPEETRNALLDLVARAEAARSGMENALSGANLPVLTTDSAGKALIVKPDLSGYTFAALGTGGNEAIEADAIETTRSKRFISDTEKGYLAALIQLNTQVYPVWTGSQTAVTPVTTVRSLEGAVAITLTGSNTADGAAVTVTTHFPSPLQIGDSYPLTWGGDEGTLTLSEASKLTLAGASFGDNTLLSVLAKFPSGEGARTMDDYAGANWEDLYRGLYAAFRPGNETHQLLTDGERTSGLPASGSVWVENTQGWARIEVMSVAAGEYVKDTTVPRDLGALLVRVDLTAADNPKYAARRGLSAPGNHSAVGLFRLVEGHSPAELDQSGGLLGTPNGFWRAELMFSDTSRVVVDLCSKGVYVYAKGNDPFTLMGCEILIPKAPEAAGNDVYDSGWFTVGSGSLETKSHGLGRVPTDCQIFVHDTYGNVHTGNNTLVVNNQSYGTGLVAITDSYVTLRTGTAGIYLAPNMAGAISSGFVKLVLR